MNRFLSRLIRAGGDPIGLITKIIGHIQPEWLFLRLQRLARQQGLKRSYFILSLDCDTDLDLEVIAQVHDGLKKVGIMPVYAVPGEQLEAGAEAYRSIAASGAEFINHGYYRHCYYDSESRIYRSTFFYDQMDREKVEDDIQRGHNAHLSILGKAPRGFRTPHFGSFQGPGNLRFLHGTLQNMGYLYSSSTLPLYGFRWGPVRQVKDSFYEIPVSGSFDNPGYVLDSWGFRYAPGRRYSEKDYLIQFEKMASLFQKPGALGLMNCYADPSQVYDWPDFFECMKLVAPIAVNSYEHLLKDLRR